MARLRQQNLSRLVGMLAAAGATVTIAVAPSPSQAADIRVPTSQPTIAAALARAAPGDRVLVAPGTYSERGLSLPEGVALVGTGGEPVLHRLDRESKPGCRVYARVDEIPSPLQGMGLVIVSTSRGVKSDRACRAERVGGELLCTVE